MSVKELITKVWSLEKITSVWCHRVNRDAPYLVVISVVRGFKKCSYQVPLFTQWWNTMQHFKMKFTRCMPNYLGTKMLKLTLEGPLFGSLLKRIYSNFGYKNLLCDTCGKNPHSLWYGHNLPKLKLNFSYLFTLKSYYGAEGYV